MATKKKTTVEPPPALEATPPAAAEAQPNRQPIAGKWTVQRKVHSVTGDSGTEAPADLESWLDIHTCDKKRDAAAWLKRNAKLGETYRYATAGEAFKAERKSCSSSNQRDTRTPRQTSAGVALRRHPSPAR
jgi:hypothetical protein